MFQSDRPDEVQSVVRGAEIGEMVQGRLKSKSSEVVELYEHPERQQLSAESPEDQLPTGACDDGILQLL
ncbi:hypothetical protein Y032_0598g465 [Ancylostoma ceylanicum]|uniref:Uncharacterized protein n=1 Tax=Ancylostoma ceylanicum TaxID=53326 RepID=A0A016WND8_9BILA|nr:hypothetical protein Y032_0598g465 [Ancylostoma ceylanicum]